MSYPDYNDAKGRDARLRREAWNGARARMLATFQEYAFGSITLHMSKHDIRRALDAGRRIHHGDSK